MDNIIFEFKWKKLSSRVWLFDFIPFVDFVFVTGSMAMGNPKEDSDFDLTIGVRQGRIFTVRFCCWLVFGILGWRKKKGLEGKRSKDKFCFNHFVAPERYRLAEPHNEYWRKLYQSLILVYGAPELIQKFYDANADWTGPVKNHARAQARSRGPFGRAVFNGMKRIKKIKEEILSGKLGDLLEFWLKKIQIAKIEESLKTEKLYKSRITYTDSELEFHPDIKRIEEYLFCHPRACGDPENLDSASSAEWQTFSRTLIKKSGGG